MSTQAALAFDPPESVVDREFAAYCETPHGRALEAEIVLRARRLKARGFASYGIAALFEAIRYDRSVDLGPTCEEWRCNNNHRAGLARKIMRAMKKKRGRKPSLTLTINGRKALLVDWARDLDINAKIVRSRIDSGWTPEDAVSIPQTREGRAGARRARAAKMHNEPATVSRPPAPFEAPGLRPCFGSARSFSLSALHLAAGRYDETHEGGAK